MPILYGMKDLAMQAYIEYLQDVIKTQEQAGQLKDQLIIMLEDRVKLQETMMADLQNAVNQLTSAVGLPMLFPQLETKP